MPMIARMLSGAGRRMVSAVAGLMLLSVAGCQAIGKHHEARQVPKYGVIDPTQARELHKALYPPYVLEPPDELEITVRPSLPDWSPSTFVVQPDGSVDLGFVGDVYVAGMTLRQAEEQIAMQVAAQSRPNNGGTREPYQVSVRLANNQSKYYYVLGTVVSPGRVKTTGNETVLDAIVQAGLRSNSLPEKAYLVRPHPAGAPDQILKIDWCGIKDRGDTLTNYQILPGDRIVVPGTKDPGLLGSLLGR
jgi:polysaccharide export outer membrane protein